MIFSSLIFLYIFLPTVLLGFYLIRNDYRNGFLFLSSLVFFAWGGVSYTTILIASITINYLCGRLIGSAHSNRRKIYLGLGVTINLLLLGVFKYANFIIENINSLFSWLDIPTVTQTHILLPIGISFYTFQAMSYLIDVYRKEVKTQKNFINLGLYISLFPQLIAGPIVRYHDINLQLSKRTYSYKKFSSGVMRFTLGMAKKVFIANNMAIIADHFFNMETSSLSPVYAWLGIIAYTLQIYYDFAGYSDMAIGLGRMFGFQFLENFNFPYIAKSIMEFWRRWHISLSSWFRDYLYIPLGGNRRGKYRTYFNLFLVFFVTGFWHGSSWNFIVWGLLHGTFLVIERVGFGKILEKLPSIFRNIYTLFVVIIAWVLFRANDFSHAWEYYKSMFGATEAATNKYEIFQYVNYEIAIYFSIGVLGAFNFFPFVYKLANRFFKNIMTSNISTEVVFPILKATFVIVVLLATTGYLLSNSYNPFIYYRF